MVLIGYFLPTVINPLLRPVFGPDFQVQDHVEKVVILVVLLSISPGIYVWLRSKFGKKQPIPEAAVTAQAHLSPGADAAISSASSQP